MAPHKNKKLTIVITNYNTSRFIENLLETVARTTKNPYTVLINDNGSPQKDQERLRAVAAKYDDVWIHYRQGENHCPSLAKGNAIDALVRHVATPYFAILDSDTAILLQDWDEILIKELDKKTKLIGTPQTEGFSGKKKTDFPFEFIVMFETEAYKKLNPTWKPDVNNLETKDTGWEVKGKYLRAKYSSKIFTAKNTRVYKKGPYKKVICTEYYWKDKLVGTHFGRGWTGGYHKYAGTLHKKFGIIYLIGIPFFSILARIWANNDRVEWIRVSQEQSKKKKPWMLK